MAGWSQEELDQISEFWELLKMNIHGFPEKKASRKPTQWSGYFNNEEDQIAFCINSKFLQIYIQGKESEDRHLRMQMYTEKMIKIMTDQKFSRKLGQKGLENDHKDGRSIRIEISWVRSDKGCWQEAASWVSVRYEILIKDILGCSQ